MTFLIDGVTVLLAAMFAGYGWRQARDARSYATRASIAVVLARQAQASAEDAAGVVLFPEGQR